MAEATTIAPQTTLASSSIRVLVVDDTATYRKILSDALTPLPNVFVAATAPSAALAIKRLAQGDIDVVLLDVVMPEMGGLEALDIIRRDFPSVITIMISGALGPDADVTVKALARGALDFVPKPQAASYSENMTLIQNELSKIFSIVLSKRRQQPSARSQQASIATAAPTAPRPSTVCKVAPRIELVLIGVSTGGPKALQEVLPKIASTIGCPILIVQHMPPLFTASLAEQLARASSINVREAKEGDIPEAGTALIAPGGFHMTLKKNTAGAHVIALNQDAPVNSCRPAVDVLFKSAAESFQGNVLTVILTGMGDDGANGVEAFRRRGRSWSIAQNEQTCVVYGMPYAVVNRGLADEVLPLDKIASRICSLVPPKLGSK